MSCEKEEIRPAIISIDSYSFLDELRRFRHLVRNVYTFNLVPGKIEPIIVTFPDSWSKLQDEMLAFAEFLEQIG